MRVPRWGTQHRSVLEKLDPEFLVGLTATPWRSDEVSLRDLFGDPVYSKSIVEAMSEGWLAEVITACLADNCRGKTCNR